MQEVYDICLCADLNYLEETAGGPRLTVATLPKSGKIVFLQVLLPHTVHTELGVINMMSQPHTHPFLS